MLCTNKDRLNLWYRVSHGAGSKLQIQLRNNNHTTIKTVGDLRNRHRLYRRVNIVVNRYSITLSLILSATLVTVYENLFPVCCINSTRHCNVPARNSPLLSFHHFSRITAA
jgi:hypothetical protein